MGAATLGRAVLGGAIVLVPMAVVAVASRPATGGAQPPPGPVRLVWPVDEGRVFGPNVLVAWDAPGAEIVPPAEAEDPDHLHAHLILDGIYEVEDGEPIPRRDGILHTTDNPAVLADLDPGRHQVQLVLTGPDHVPVADRERPAVGFEVLGPHPANVYAGTCGALDDRPSFRLEDVGSGAPAPERAPDDPAVVEPPVGPVGFVPVRVSESTVGASLGDLLRTPHAVTVHVSAEDRDTLVACGNIGGPAYRGTLRVGLLGDDGARPLGVVTLAAEGQDVRVTVELLEASPVVPVVAGVSLPPDPGPTPTRRATLPPPLPEDPTDTPISAPTQRSVELPTDTPIVGPATELPATDTPIVGPVTETPVPPTPVPPPPPPTLVPPPPTDVPPFPTARPSDGDDDDDDDDDGGDDDDDGEDDDGEDDDD